MTAGESGFRHFQQCVLKSFEELFQHNLEQSYRDASVLNPSGRFQVMVPSWDGNVVPKFIHEFNYFTKRCPDRSFMEDASRSLRYLTEIDALYFSEFEDALQVMKNPYFHGVVTMRSSNRMHHAVVALNSHSGALICRDPSKNKAVQVDEKTFISLVVPTVKIVRTMDSNGIEVQPPKTRTSASEVWTALRQGKGLSIQEALESVASERVCSKGDAWLKDLIQVHDLDPRGKYNVYRRIRSRSFQDLSELQDMNDVQWAQVFPEIPLQNRIRKAVDAEVNRPESGRHCAGSHPIDAHPSPQSSRWQRWQECRPRWTFDEECRGSLVRPGGWFIPINL